VGSEGGRARGCHLPRIGESEPGQLDLETPMKKDEVEPGSYVECRPVRLSRFTLSIQEHGMGSLRLLSQLIPNWFVLQPNWD
jgi:hypothetical protein